MAAVKRTPKYACENISLWVGLTLSGFFSMLQAHDGEEQRSCPYIASPAHWANSSPRLAIASLA